MPSPPWVPPCLWGCSQGTRVWLLRLRSVHHRRLLAGTGGSDHTPATDRVSHHVPCCACPCWVHRQPAWPQPSSCLLPWGCFSLVLPPRKTPERGMGRVGGGRGGRGERGDDSKGSNVQKGQENLEEGGHRGCWCSRPVAVHTSGAAGEQGPWGSSSSRMQPRAAASTFTAFTRSGSSEG